MTLFVEMLQAAGNRALIMVFTGILCTVWGAFQFYYPPQTRSRILHLICSTTPALLGLWAFYGMLSAYTHVAHSTAPPTRADLDLVMSNAVVFGSLSLLGTLLPLSLAIAGMMKQQSSMELAS